MHANCIKSTWLPVPGYWDGAIVVSSSLRPVPVFFCLAWRSNDLSTVKIDESSARSPLQFPSQSITPELPSAGTALAVLQMFRELASESLETFGNIGDEFRGGNSLWAGVFNSVLAAHAPFYESWLAIPRCQCGFFAAARASLFVSRASFHGRSVRATDASCPLSTGLITPVAEAIPAHWLWLVSRG